MRRYVFQLTFLALAALGTSVVLGNDQQIAKTIVEKLSAEKKAGHLKGFNIELNVDDGTVWLSGRVASEEQRTVALEIARRVQGVKQVVNDLNVEATPVKQAFTPVAHEIGTGVNGGEAAAPMPVPVAPQLQAVPIQQLPARQQPIPYAYGRSNNMVPMAYAPARTIAYQGEGAGGAPMPISGGGATGMAAARYDHPNMPGYAWPSYASHPNYAAVTYPKQYSPTAWPYIGPFYPYPQVPLGWRRVCLEWDDGWWFLDFNAKRH
ncbi:MAG: BON domain-containing protein [Pirellulaceae bacterium]